MGDDDRRELAELRLRAYGPAADIADDPEALARLRALELARRPVPPAPPAPVAPPPPAGARRVAAPPRPPLPPAPRRRRGIRLGRRGLWAAWAASILVVGAASAAVTTAVYLARDAHDVTLQPLAEPRPTTPTTIFGLSGDIVAYDDFAGIQVLTAQPRDNVCIVVQARVNASSPEENAVNCAPEGLPVTVDLVVRRSYPDEVTERFPPGTTLRFTFDGGVVGVDIVEPDAAPGI